MAHVGLGGGSIHWNFSQRVAGQRTATTALNPASAHFNVVLDRLQRTSSVYSLPPPQHTEPIPQATTPASVSRSAKKTPALRGGRSCFRMYDSLRLAVG